MNIDQILNALIAVVDSILLVFNVSPVNLHPIHDPVTAPSGYEMVFEDEFDNQEEFKANWHHHNGEGIRKGGYWYEDNAQLDGDGHLIITTQYKNGNSGPGWYTAGLSTEDTKEFTRGYFECRCILPKGEGLWSAFWLTNDNVTSLTTGNARQGAELDVFESPYWYLGGRAKNKVTCNIHYNGYELQTRYHNVGIYQIRKDPYKYYHTYGLEWTKDKYIFYIDGHKVGTSTYGGISQEPEYLILSCEVDGANGKPSFGWSGNIEKNNKETFKSEFTVDYVRVYQKPEDINK